MTIEIKCVKPVCPYYNADYAKNDTFADYCPACLEKNKQIAIQIDKQMADKKHKTVKSDFQLYDEMVRKTGIKFPQA